MVSVRDRRDGHRVLHALGFGYRNLHTHLTTQQHNIETRAAELH
jgi:hypothetical protein